MKPILKVALNKCGVQKRLPRKLVYGTLRSRGLGLKDPYWIQLIQHLLAILRHSHRDTPTHDLIHENMELVQFHVGSERTFWDLPYQQYGTLAPRGWIKHTWKALDETSLHLTGPSLALPRRRTRDVFLMDAFIAQGYEGDDLMALQDCRLHLKAVRLSDITTADGWRIEPRAWAGKASWQCTAPPWIGTYRPTADKVSLWQEALRATFMVPDQTSMRLNEDLGPWLQEDDPHWIWWRHYSSHSLFEQREPGVWYKWSRRGASTHHRHKFMNPVPVQPEAVPPVKFRASVHRPRRSVYVTVLTTGVADQVPTAPPT